MKYYFRYGKEHRKIYLDNFSDRCLVCGSSFLYRKEKSSFDEIMIVKCTKCVCRTSIDKLKIFSNDMNFIEKIIDDEKNRRKKSNSIERYIEIHGEEKGKEKFDHWKSTCRTGKETLIQRHGEEEGNKRFEVFREKSKQNKQNFVKRYGEENGIIEWEKYLKLKKETTSLSLEYWLEKTDGDLELARDLLKDRQGRYNRLNYFIDKYGDELGKIRFEELNSRKTKNWKNAGRFSKISIKLFDEIQKKIKYRAIYGENGEKRISGYWIDFFIEEKNICIEFNGDYWHANPEIYEENDVLNIIKKTAKDLWDKDFIKKEKIESLGYKYLTIWEKDAYKDINKCVDKCISFIEGE